jgi:hypothetical protein
MTCTCASISAGSGAARRPQAPHNRQTHGNASACPISWPSAAATFHPGPTNELTAPILSTPARSRASRCAASVSVSHASAGMWAQCWSSSTPLSTPTNQTRGKASACLISWPSASGTFQPRLAKELTAPLLSTPARSRASWCAASVSVSHTSVSVTRTSTSWNLCSILQELDALEGSHKLLFRYSRSNANRCFPHCLEHWLRNLHFRNAECPEHERRIVSV